MFFKCSITVWFFVLFTHIPSYGARSLAHVLRFGPKTIDVSRSDAPIKKLIIEELDGDYVVTTCFRHVAGTNPSEEMWPKVHTELEDMYSTSPLHGSLCHDDCKGAHNHFRTNDLAVMRQFLAETVDAGLWGSSLAHTELDHYAWPPSTMSYGDMALCATTGTVALGVVLYGSYTLCKAVVRKLGCGRGRVAPSTAKKKKNRKRR